jgi:hypothetical protein
MDEKGMFGKILMVKLWLFFKFLLTKRPVVLQGQKLVGN